MNQMITLEPSADAWVYTHATDGGRDPYLRVWGAGGKSVAPDASEIENFSYGYMKFTLPKDLPGGELKSATLVLTHISDPAYSKDFSKEYPIEVHELGTAFEDKTWSYDIAAKLTPSVKNIYGTGWAEDLVAGKEFKIKIDLLKGPYSLQKSVEKAVKADRQIGFALAAKIDVAEVGTKSAYKVFSHDAENVDKRPKLVLEFK